MMRWFRPGSDRMHETDLEERVTVLQSALASCKEVATRWMRIGRELVAAAAVVFLALGFALGVYREQIEQAIFDLAAAVGIVESVPNAEAAEAAYEKGDYEKALRVSRPLAE